MAAAQNLVGGRCLLIIGVIRLLAQLRFRYVEPLSKAHQATQPQVLKHPPGEGPIVDMSVSHHLWNSCVGCVCRNPSGLLAVDMGGGQLMAFSCLAEPMLQRHVARMMSRKAE